LAKLQGIQWGKVAGWMVDGIVAYFTASGDAWAWFASLDWATVGQKMGELIGQAIVLSFKAAAWIFVGLPMQLGEAFRNADYAAIGKAILDYFAKLGPALLKIGTELMEGLIKGLMDAIPGLSTAVDAVNATLGAVKGAAHWVGELATPKDITPKPAAPGPGPVGDQPWMQSLLSKVGLAKPPEVKNTTNVTVNNALPGTTTSVTQTTNGVPVPANADVGHNRAGMAAANG
jgi:hypothetical protein